MGTCLSGCVWARLSLSALPSPDLTVIQLPCSAHDPLHLRLLPCRPLMYEPTLYPREQGVNFIQMWSWVRQHPEQVRSVVQESTLFAERHLSRQGKTCYSVRLLLAYAENIADAERIEALFKKADGIYGTA